MPEYTQDADSSDARYNGEALGHPGRGDAVMRPDKVGKSLGLEADPGQGIAGEG